MRDRSYEIALNLKCDGYQRGLASMVYEFFDIKIGAGGIATRQFRSKCKRSASSRITQTGD